MKVRFVSKMKKHGRKYLWVHRLMMTDAQLVLVAAVILLQQEKGENETLFPVSPGLGRLLIVQIRPATSNFVNGVGHRGRHRS